MASPDDVDAFLSARGKTLPAAPVWAPHKSREGEMKARLPIECDGAIAGPEIEITLRTADPNYIAMVLIMPACVARLCIGTSHRNRVTGGTLTEPHFHRWSDNRNLPTRTRAELPFAELLPEDVRTRDASFAWFLSQVGIESPHWLPVAWPSQGGLF